MKQVRVQKAKLVEILTKNRAEHRDIFLAAQTKYREVVVKALDEQLKRARDGSPFNLSLLVRITAPQDHTKDYDRALRMLDMSVDETLVLTEQEFAQFVEDNWGWSRSWAASNSAYTTSPKLAEFMADSDE